ncbi:MAG: hypothetical protein ABI220_01405 [Candidatus Saccharimonadales bacterium]
MSEGQTDLDGPLHASVRYYFNPRRLAPLFKKAALGQLKLNNNRLTLADSEGEQVLNYSISEIIMLKRWAPMMRFKFSDGGKLFLDFNQLDNGMRGGIDKPTIAQMQPFERYFSQLGLIK